MSEETVVLRNGEGKSLVIRTNDGWRFASRRWEQLFARRVRKFEPAANQHVLATCPMVTQRAVVVEEHSRTLGHESEPSPSAGYLTRARWATVPV
jgi:hypothetical protein